MYVTREHALHMLIKNLSIFTVVNHVLRHGHSGGMSQYKSNDWLMQIILYYIIFYLYIYLFIIYLFIYYIFNYFFLIIWLFMYVLI